MTAAYTAQCVTAQGKPVDLASRLKNLMGGARMSSELRQLMEQRSLEVHFQPIFCSRDSHEPASGGNTDAQLLGHEALARGPAGSMLQAPLELLRAADSCGLSQELDLLLLERAGLRPRDLVLEITEHGLNDEPGKLRDSVQPLRALGCEIAIDDLGAGSSGLKIWSELRPDYVKIDRYFIEHVETDAIAAEVLRSMLDMAHVMGSRVVAEGIESAGQCRLLRDQGVDYLQGYFLGCPQAELQFVCPALASVGDTQTLQVVSCAEQLAAPRPPVTTTTRVIDVVALFQANADWDSLAVVSGERAVGIVHRDRLLTLLSKPLYPDIFNRKPVTRVMDAVPLVIDARARLDQVSRLVTNSSAGRLDMEFIVARHGNYLGIGRTVELLRQITDQQVQAAKQSNPLTLLPGNLEIEQQLARVLALRVPFVICHGDLDSFKPFNDAYGYSHGDQVLLHVADLFRRIASSSVDFVGHLGGDDFILILRSPDWQARLRRLFETFDASMPNFYSSAHREAGGILGRDREGAERSLPLMTLSVAAVRAKPGDHPSAAALQERLRIAKTRAKSKRGHALMLDEGASIADLAIAAVTTSNLVERRRVFPQG